MTRNNKNPETSLNTTECLEIGTEVHNYGNFGNLYKAVYTTKKTTCYVKILTKNDLSRLNKINDDYFDILKIIGTLTHPNILKIWDRFDINNQLWIVYENSTGKNLCTEIHENFRNGFCFSEWTVMCYAHDLLSALVYLHKNCIVHKDIQPHNITISTMDAEEGSQPKSFLKIHDFTRSRILENNQMEKTFKQDPMLVNHFSSPEILSNNDYNHKTDVWSVAVICYVMISGAYPFCASSLDRVLYKMKNRIFNFNSERWKTITEDMKHFLRKCFRPDIEKRISSIDAFQHNWFTNLDNSNSINKSIMRKSFRIEMSENILESNIIESSSTSPLTKFRTAVYVVLTTIICQNIILKSSDTITDSTNKPNSLKNTTEDAKTDTSITPIIKSKNLINNVCSEIAKYVTVDEFSPTLFEILSKETFKAVIETFQSMKNSIPLKMNIDSLMELSMKEIDHNVKDTKIAIIRKNKFYQKIGIIVVSTRHFFCIVAKIIPGELADLEGTLKVGDRIIKINGIELKPKNYDSNGNELEIQEKAASVVLQANELLRSNTLELEILVEPGYLDLLPKKLIFDKKNEEKENKRSLLIARYFKSLKDLSPELSQDLNNQRCLPLKKGDIVAVEDFTIINEIFWNSEKIQPSFIPELSSEYLACFRNLENRATRGLVPLQNEFSKELIQNRSFRKKLNLVSKICARNSSRKLQKILEKSHPVVFMKLYEEVVLIKNYPYKSVVIISHDMVDFNAIIKNVCSRTVLTHTMVPIATTNSKFSDNPRYKVIKEQEFLKLIKNKQLVKWAIQNSEYYGYLKKSVFEIIESKKVAIFSINPNLLSNVRDTTFQPMVIYLKHLSTFSEGKRTRTSAEISEISEYLTVAETETFEDVRHMTDFYVEFETDLEASVTILRILQSERYTFVNADWVRAKQ